MVKTISITEISNSAWKALKDHQNFWMVLILGAIFALSLKFYLEKFQWFCAYQYLLPVVCSIISMIWYTIVCNNALDIVYGKKISGFAISQYIFIAAVFDMTNFSKAIQYLISFVAFVEDQWLRGLIIGSIACLQLYIVVRCIFMGMVLLHDKLSIVQALKKTLRLTSGKFFTLLGAFGYCCMTILVSILLLSLVLAGIYLFFSLGLNIDLKDIPVDDTVLVAVGYCVISPIFYYLYFYFILFLAFLFKQLNDQLES